MTPPSDVGDPLGRALAWLDTHVDWLRPTTWTQHLHPLPVPTQTLVEALLLARVLARSDRADAQALVVRLREMCSGELEAALPGDTLGLLDDQTVYRLWVVALLGERAPEPMRRRAADVFATCGPALLGPEAPVTLALEAAYVGRLGGWTPVLPRFADLRPDGYPDLDVGLVDEGEVYAVTHDLFYDTDLGQDALRAGPGVADGVGAVVDALLGRMLTAEHWDLACELLLCSQAWGTGPLGPITVRAVHAAQLASGAVPGPDHDPAVAATRTGVAAIAYEFRTCYHTTLVCAMALATAGVPAGPMERTVQ